MSKAQNIINRIAELGGPDVANHIIDEFRGWTPASKIADRLAELSSPKVRDQINSEHRSLVYIKRQPKTIRIATWRVSAALKDHRHIAVIGSIFGGWFVPIPARLQRQR